MTREPGRPEKAHHNAATSWQSGLFDLAGIKFCLLVQDVGWLCGEALSTYLLPLGGLVPAQWRGPGGGWQPLGPRLQPGEASGQPREGPPRAAVASTQGDGPGHTGRAAETSRAQDCGLTAVLLGRTKDSHALLGHPYSAPGSAFLGRDHTSHGPAFITWAPSHPSYIVKVKSLSHV